MLLIVCLYTATTSSNVWRRARLIIPRPRVFIFLYVSPCASPIILDIISNDISVALRVSDLWLYTCNEVRRLKKLFFLFYLLLLISWLYIVDIFLIYIKWKILYAVWKWLLTSVLSSHRKSNVECVDAAVSPPWFDLRISIRI